nr:ABC transporter substrate-binding protein [Ensifer aridi]
MGRAVGADGRQRRASAGACRGWGASKDAKVWTFKIREGVQFHNGKEMNPADVLATMERHSNEKSKSAALGIMKGIEKIAVERPIHAREYLGRRSQRCPNRRGNRPYARRLSRP